MPNQLRRICRAMGAGAAIAVAAAAIVASGLVTADQAPDPPPPADAMPRYDADRQLVLPDDYRQWVLVGSSLGLSYAEGGQGSRMFHATLMEPGAWRHFLDTGTFREGTMFALILQGIGDDAAPARHGQFATDVHAVELAVKDSARVPEGWAYYDFGGSMTRGLRSAAAPQPKGRCYDCHAEHAATDHVFTQFYGLLRDAATVRSGAR